MHWNTKAPNVDLLKNVQVVMVRDDPKLQGDSGEVPISEWSGWRFDFHYENFSLLDGKKLAK